MIRVWRKFQQISDSYIPMESRVLERPQSVGMHMYKLDKNITSHRLNKSQL